MSFRHFSAYMEFPLQSRFRLGGSWMTLILGGLFAGALAPVPGEAALFGGGRVGEPLLVDGLASLYMKFFARRSPAGSKTTTRMKDKRSRQPETQLSGTVFTGTRTFGATRTISFFSLYSTPFRLDCPLNAATRGSLPTTRI